MRFAQPGGRGVVGVERGERIALHAGGRARDEKGQHTAAPATSPAAPSSAIPPSPSAGVGRSAPRALAWWVACAGRGRLLAGDEGATMALGVPSEV